MEYTAKKFKFKEDFIKYAKAVVNGYCEIISTFGVIAEAGKKFDGKVFNKRFNTEIENQLKEKGIPTFVGISDPYSMGYKTLKVYLRNRDICINGNCYYFDKEIAVASIHNCESSFINEEGRIIGEKVAETCNEEIKMCEEQVKKWNDAIEHYDEYTAQLENAVKQFGEALRGLNRLFRPSQIDSYDWETAIGLH